MILSSELLTYGIRHAIHSPKKRCDIYDVAWCIGRFSWVLKFAPRPKMNAKPKKPKT